jgi:hypothetical protein
VRSQDPERLRQALDRLMDAQREALEATDRALELPGDGEAEYRLEEILVDIRDILAGATDDVRDILGDERRYLDA